jgi:hypothetical protein
MCFRAPYRLREPGLRDWFPERELDFELRPVLPDLVDVRLREDDDERVLAFGRVPDERAPAFGGVPDEPFGGVPDEPFGGVPDERALAGREP